MPRASRLADDAIAYLGPLVYGARRWWAACHRDPALVELDPVA